MAKFEISVMPPLIGSPSIGSTNARNILRNARLADQLGFNAILLQDLIGIEGAETNDCLVTLGAVAAITKRVRVGTLATPLPLRHPAFVAKAMATVGHISSARAILTVGAGWVKDDFEWYGLRYEGFMTRIKMMEEGIRFIKACWRNGKADFQGKFFKLSEPDLQPKPVQRPRPPIWVAGVSDEALKIAVREGDGWFGWRGIDPKRFSLRVRLVDSLCRTAGRRRSDVKNAMRMQVSIARDQDSLRRQAGKWMNLTESKDPHSMISYGTPSYFVDLLQGYSDAGANHVNVVFVPVVKSPEQLKLFAKKVLPHFR